MNSIFMEKETEKTSLVSTYPGKPTVVGVAGGSASGKTTMVNHIMSSLDINTYVVLDNDSYYKSFPELSLLERSQLNFDHPHTLDQALFLQHIRALKAGQSIRKPVYNFREHQRSSETLLLSPKKIIIVEGILVLEDQALREEMDIKIFVDTDPDIRLIRRLTRDIRERGRSLEMVFSQYLTTVKPMYEKFVEPTKRYADVILPRGGDNQVAIDMVVSKLRSLIHS
jgi:uridine kinase